MGERTGLDQVLPSVRAFLRAVALHYPVEAAYVFGSYARGTAGPDSDIDVAVVSSAFSGKRFEDNVALARLTWGIDTRIEPVALRPESLASDNSLAATIHAEGFAVPLESDMEERVSIEESEAILKAA
jgi:predicted nucleotidyltransferase